TRPRPMCGVAGRIFRQRSIMPRRPSPAGCCTLPADTAPSAASSCSAARRGKCSRCRLPARPRAPQRTAASDTSLGAWPGAAAGEAPWEALRAVYGYDVTRRGWNRLPDLPTPRHGLGVAALDGVVYVIGGGPQPGLHVTGANESLRIR